jgi:hypothetical protein
LNELIDSIYVVDSSSLLLDSSEDEVDEDVEEEQSIDARELASQIVSYCIGAIFGRWDIRLANGQEVRPRLPDPFAPLPACPPGMLQGKDGLPLQANELLTNYPVNIDRDGILVDEADHQDDIVRRIRDVFTTIWGKSTESIEREVCDALNVKELRAYLRPLGNGGFWMDHIRRYSKSRRKAPIYWLLQSTNRNYALWLYYPCLDKDTLFKALVNYVEPKMRLEENKLRQIRGQMSGAGTSGKTAKQLERELNAQEDFISEMQDFYGKLKRAAERQLIPDLNDGVLLNIAPLWELVPWKEVQTCWESLMDGEYEWSSIGKQLREKGLVSKRG